MRFEQPIAVVTRRLVIAMVREIEAVRSLVKAIGYEAFHHRLFGNAQLHLSWAYAPGNPMASMPWGSTARGSLPMWSGSSFETSKLATGHLLLAGKHVGKPDTRQHRRKPMLASCPASLVDIAKKHLSAASLG